MVLTEVIFIQAMNIISAAEQQRAQQSSMAGYNIIIRSYVVPTYDEKVSFAKVAQSSPKTRNLEKSGNEKNNRNFFLLITNLHLGGGASSISPFLILGSQNIFFRC